MNCKAIHCLLFVDMPPGTFLKQYIIQFSLLSHNKLCKDYHFTHAHNYILINTHTHSLHTHIIPIQTWYPNACGELSTMTVLERSLPRIPSSLMKFPPTQMQWSRNSLCRISFRVGSSKFNSLSA